MKNHYTMLYCLMLLSFLSFLGISLPHPMLAQMFLNETGDLNSNILPYSIILSAYPLGQFLGSPILGTFSDHLGRKTTLALSLIMTSIGYLLSILSLTNNSFVILLFSRFFTGFWEGILPITRAAAADLENTVDMSRSFSLINAAATSGFLLGPIIGFFLHSNIFIFSFLLTIFALLILLTFYKDKNYLGFKKGTQINSINIIKSIWSPLREYKNLKYILASSTLITLSFDILYRFLPLFLIYKWQANFHQISIAIFILSFSLMLAPLILIKKINNRIKIELVIIIASSLYGIALISLIVINNYSYAMLAIAVLGMLIGIISTNLPILVLNIVPKNLHGQIMGIMVSLRFLGDGLMCLIGGLISNISPVAPIVTASVFIVIGTVLFIATAYSTIEKNYLILRSYK